MKIAIDLTVLDYNKEGIGRYVLSLVKNISYDKYKEIFVLIKYVGQVLPNEIENKFSIFEVPRHKYFKGFNLGLDIRKMQNKGLFDVVLSTHSHIVTILAKKAYWLIHDVGPVLHPSLFIEKVGFFEKLVHTIRIILFKFAIYKAEKIVTTSNQVIKEIGNILNINKNKINSIGTGITLEMINSSIVPSRNLANLQGKEFILNVGTISPRKNISTLLDAYEQANLYAGPSNVIPDLVIAGKKGWNYKSVFQKLNSFSESQPDLYAKIHYLDYVTDKELNWLYKNSKCLIYPSLYEGIGLPPMESMQLGIPAVISDIEIFQEFYQDTAIFFELKMDKGLSSMIEMILNLNERLADYNKDSVINILNERYNWVVVSKNLIKFVLK